MNLLCDVRSV